ncbi:hypothetical protein V3C99_012471 [Haemonchus contortus]|uniref:Oxidoreductase n=1 Tax=Haemonchus contortus TaxID=6289 RepID=A0A7I4Y2V5_HAECO
MVQRGLQWTFEQPHFSASNVLRSLALQISTAAKAFTTSIVVMSGLALREAVGASGATLFRRDDYEKSTHRLLPKRSASWSN